MTRNQAMAAILCCGLSAATAFAGAPDFATEVIPVLTKAGCNSGACHGAAIGRGGFRLSLLGYDPDADYEAMLDEFEGRRVNLVRPERSLLLLKPSRRLPHDGGLKLKTTSEGYRLVRDWIEAGAPRGGGIHLQRLEIVPTSITLPSVNESVAIKVTAHFNDGRSRDVTDSSIFSPLDKGSLSCDDSGRVRPLRPGQHAVMVRFLGEVGCVRIRVPLHEQKPPTSPPRSNFIDDYINRTMADLRLPHSPRAGDHELIRRLHLDLIGTLPTADEVDAFVNSQDTDKFSRLVDRLLKRPEYVDFWSYKWGDLLQIESKRLQPEGAASFHRWIREQVAANTPYDQIAKELILSVGDGYKHGPANFHRVPSDARAEAEYVSRVFLGVRLQCANCHNHPFDRWTQNDYHGLSAIFARLSRGRFVSNKPAGEVIHPKTSKPARRKIPGGRFLEEKEPGRQRFTDWLTSPHNPHFARAAANRIWRELMGRGLVEPVDDLRATNPPTHPELLDALARDFIEHRFDVRRLIKTIVTSEAYRRSSRSVEGNEGDGLFYSKALVKPLPPVVLVDAVAYVTGVAEPLGNVAPGTRAIALGDARVSSEPLDLLGRCDRTSSCESSAPAGLPLTLHAIHGDWLNKKIASPQGRLHQMIAAGRSDGEIVSTFYRLALSRPPSERESAWWREKLKTGNHQERVQTLEDFVWALLNSAEFCSNH
ncbi:MAG: surface protein [Gemmatales bacterium]|nr:MAG: surface protein [Gemmatales bacterium]